MHYAEICSTSRVAEPVFSLSTRTICPRSAEQRRRGGKGHVTVLLQRDEHEGGAARIERRLGDGARDAVWTVTRLRATGQLNSQGISVDGDALLR